MSENESEVRLVELKREVCYGGNILKMLYIVLAGCSMVVDRCIIYINLYY